MTEPKRLELQAERIRLVQQLLHPETVPPPKQPPSLLAQPSSTSAGRHIADSHGWGGCQHVCVCWLVQGLCHSQMLVTGGECLGQSKNFHHSVLIIGTSVSVFRFSSWSWWLSALI
jgi:hypothetical protein